MFLGFSAVLPGVAEGVEISGDIVASGNYMINQDVTVLNGVLFEAHDIVATDSIRILNYGHMAGGINVCENCSVEIRNIGVFDAGVTLQNGAHFVQVITANNEITNLGLGSGFDVAVRNGAGLSFADVMSVAGNANTVEFVNADFNAGTVGGFVAPSNVKLSGDIILHFDDITNQEKLLFSKASGGGVVYADSNALDSLHIMQTYRVNNDVFMRLARSTDYARILNNGMGCFLNDLRAFGVDFKLFSKLDVAENMGEINNILSDSVRTNPIKLMRPVSIINSYKSLEIMHIDDGVTFGIEPLLIYSGNMLVEGAQPKLAFNMSDDLHVELSGYVLNIDYSDDINEYGGIAFGIGADLQYDISKNDFIRLHGAGGKSYFDVGPVFDGMAAVNNPDGMSIFVIGEYGRTFDVFDDYKISPFIGGGAEYMTISRASDTDVFGIGGMDVGYEYVFDGLQYNYTLRAIARTDGTIGAGINLSVWSIMDAAGADVHIGTIYNDDFGCSLKVSLNGRFMF